MKAMIFAAGLGKRLGNITESIPKALVDINGKTVLQMAVEKCSAYGFKDIIINVHHFADMGVPFIHLYDLREIATQFELPKSPVPLPEPGNGGVFATMRYDVRVAAGLLVVFFIIIGFVIYHDRKQYILTEEGADPDTLPIAK